MKIIFKSLQRSYLFCIFISFFGIYAQQDVQYTQYMYNTMSINPAYTGSEGFTSIFGLYRTQWVGLEGSPKVASIAIQTPLNHRGNGVGFVIENNQIGPSDETSFNISYAYALNFPNVIKLSFGIRAGAMITQIDHSKLKIVEEDPSFNGMLNKLSPNVGAGTYLYSKKWYIGVSVPNILKTDLYDDIKKSTVSQRMNFYAIGGYVFDFSEDIKFKPTTLLKVVPGVPMAVDLSVNFLFYEKLTTGLAYRLDAAFSALAGFQITKGLFVGYAYDYDTHSIQKYNSGSHEIFLRYNITPYSIEKMISPRFF